MVIVEKLGELGHGFDALVFQQAPEFRVVELG